MTILEVSTVQASSCYRHAKPTVFFQLAIDRGTKSLQKKLRDSN